MRKTKWDYSIYIGGSNMEIKRQEIIIWVPWKKGDIVKSEGKVILTLYHDGHIGSYFRMVENSGNCSMYTTVSIPKP
jgi:hypothetical protein